VQASETRPATEPLDKVETQVKGGAIEASPWNEGLGRIGNAAKGVVSLITGVLTVQAVLGRSGGVGHDHIDGEAHEFGCEGRQPFRPVLRVATFEGEVVTLDVAQFAEAGQEDSPIARDAGRSAAR
jgi:hypothetical protein